MIDSTLLRLTALEKDVKELKQALGQSFLQIQAANRMLKDNFNYTLVKCVINNKGNRDAIIDEMKLYCKSTNENDFNRMVIPAIDANIKIYEKESKELEEESE